MFQSYTPSLFTSGLAAKHAPYCLFTKVFGNCFRRFLRFPIFVQVYFLVHLTMTVCSVEFCGYYNHKAGISPDIRFYKFPRDAIRSRQWKIACGDLKLFKGRSYFVCSRHFDETAFRAIDIALKTAPSKRRLNDKAVPTLYLPKNGILAMSGDLATQAPVAVPPPISKRQLAKERKAQAELVSELISAFDQETKKVAMAKNREKILKSARWTRYVCFSSHYFNIGNLNTSFILEYD